MKGKTYCANILLSVIWGVMIMGFLIIKVFYPQIVTPPVDIPLFLAVSLVSFLIEHLISKENYDHSWIISAIIAGCAFGILPYSAGLVYVRFAVKMAVFGGITFAVSGVLFESMVRRISTGPKMKAAPVIVSFVLFLAGQCFTSIFF